MREFFFLLLITILLTSPSTSAQEELHWDLIHSDLPLWTGGKKVWPQAFASEDSIGCLHKVDLGDWEYVEGGETTWIRLTNYGAFHCFLVERRAKERVGLANSQSRLSVLVDLGRIKHEKGEAELWALQSGGRPGSDYTLLMRQQGKTTEFDVLQRKCPQEFVRSGQSLDILRTDYCAINSKDVLRNLAREMAQRTRLGKLVFVSNAE